MTEYYRKLGKDAEDIKTEGRGKRKEERGKRKGERGKGKGERGGASGICFLF
jgi:hypothetical protein